MAASPGEREAPQHSADDRVAFNLMAKPAQSLQLWNWNTGTLLRRMGPGATSLIETSPFDMLKLLIQTDADVSGLLLGEAIKRGSRTALDGGSRRNWKAAPLTRAVSRPAPAPATTGQQI